MAEKKEELDVLTFFIYVMILFTVIVGGFAALNFRKVSKESLKIRREIGNLKTMVKTATDEEFRGWIARSREGSRASGTVSEFQQFYVNKAKTPVRVGNFGKTERLQIQSNSPLGRPKDVGAGREISFKLSIKGCQRLERLIRYIHSVENEWPGARIRKIAEIKNVRNRKGESQGWDATLELTLFKIDG